MTCPVRRNSSALPAARSRAGFTLLELMLVVVIIGVLAAAVAVALRGRGDAGKRGASVVSLRNIGSMLENYQLDNNAYPATLQALVPKYISKVGKDGWKRDWVYSPNPSGANPFTLMSMGTDGQLGGTDDVDYWNMDNEQANPAGN